MEVKGPIDHFEIVELAANRVRVRVLTFEGAEYDLNLGAGDCVRATIPDDLHEVDADIAAAPYPPADDYGSLSFAPENEWRTDAGEANATVFASPGVPHRPRLLTELEQLEPQLRNIDCSECGSAEQLAITPEGVVSLCRKCGGSRRIDAGLLQQLVDRLDIKCFACGQGALRSEATEYANMLKCQNPACGSANSWRGVSDRLG